MEKALPTLLICLTLSAAFTSHGQQRTPDQSGGSMQQDSQPGSMASSADKGDRTITGCIRSSKGKYMLQSKRRKTIWLTGSENLASNLGHTVTVHGAFIGSTRSSSAAQGSDFQVKQIDVIADHCVETKKPAK